MNYNSEMNMASGLWANAIGDTNWDGATGGEFDMAEGIAAQQTSDPIIITVENSTASAKTNVEIFNALSRAGNSSLSGVVFTLTSTSEMTYDEFLKSLASDSYACKQIRVTGYSTTDALSEKQAKAPFILRYKDAKGVVVENTKVPLANPTYYSKNVVDVKFDTEVKITYSTSLKVSRIEANTTVEYQFYPNKEITGLQSISQGASSAKQLSKRKDLA